MGFYSDDEVCDKHQYKDSVGSCDTCGCECVECSYLLEIYQDNCEECKKLRGEVE